MSGMSMQDLFKHLAGHLRGNQDPPSDDALKRFLSILDDVRRQDMPCSQVFARLDEYVEREIRGEDAARLMPLLYEHLGLCRDCGDEYDALLAVLAKSAGSAKN
jgi:hypothetical protein